MQHRQRTQSLTKTLVNPRAVQPGQQAPGRSTILLFPNRLPPADGDQPAQGKQGAGKGSLSGMTVLLVEDDFIVAFDMQTLLEDAGATVVGPAASLVEARDVLGKTLPTVAVLDVNLNGEHVFPLLGDLERRKIPYLFATAYADNENLFPERARLAPRLAKPVLPNVLIGQLKKLLATE
jgi:two-component system, response regulator PdtaR